MPISASAGMPVAWETRWAYGAMLRMNASGLELSTPVAAYGVTRIGCDAAAGAAAAQGAARGDKRLGVRLAEAASTPEAERRGRGDTTAPRAVAGTDARSPRTRRPLARDE